MLNYITLSEYFRMMQQPREAFKDGTVELSPGVDYRNRNEASDRNVHQEDVQLLIELMIVGTSSSTALCN